MSSANQTWVTGVTCNNDVQKALILCSSLRRVHTSRKIAALVSSAVRKDLRDILQSKYDLMLSFEVPKDMSKLNEKDYAKVFSWIALRSFGKCTYLSCSSMVLKNCDEIFKTELNIEFVLPEDNLNIFVFRPSADNYNSIMSTLPQAANIYADISSYIIQWLRVRTPTRVLSIDAKYLVEMSPERNLPSFEQDIGIIHFSEATYPTAMPEMAENFELSFGLLGKRILLYWKELFEMDVQALMTNTISQLASIEHTTCYEKEPIAIIGTSLKLSLANNTNEFWKILMNADEADNKPTSNCGTTRNAFTRFDSGCIETPIGEFNDMSPNGTLSENTQIGLLHVLVWEALEDSCIDAMSLRNTNGGIFVGSTLTTKYKDCMSCSKNERGLRQYTENDLRTSTARLASSLGLVGPCIFMDSTCSSSLVAVHTACKSLICGDTNMALVCGINDHTRACNKQNSTSAISTHKHCKTLAYDKPESGICFVLKRYSDAQKDGDRVWALIRGSSMGQETVCNFGSPSIYTESSVIKKALEDARVLPEQVGYVVAHKTDRIEIETLDKTYGVPERTMPLVIGTVENITCVADSCTGMAGIVKVLLSMHHQKIPLKTVVNINAISTVLPLVAVNWLRSTDQPRIAGVTSAGLEGGRAHIIVEEPPLAGSGKPLELSEDLVKERSLHILKISARSKNKLHKLIDLYCKYMSKLDYQKDKIQNITFSANTGRSNFSHRAFVLAADKAELQRNLQGGRFEIATSKSTEDDIAARICFVFTGEGSQYQGMAKSLYETSPVFRIHFDYCCQFLANNHGLNIKQVVWGLESELQSNINKTVYSHTSIFSVEYALSILWNSWGIRPKFVLGHGLGEFCAAVCAGHISLKTALTLVVERSLLIDSLPKGDMLVVRADKESVIEQLQYFASSDYRTILDIAAVNSDQQTVVAGEARLVREFSVLLKQQKIPNSTLLVGCALYSRQMDKICIKYKQIVKNLMSSNMPLQQPTNISFISASFSRLLGDQRLNTDHWVNHLRQPVNFLGASQQAVAQGCRIFIEIGPQPILSALILKNFHNCMGNSLLCLPSLYRIQEDWRVLLRSVGKLYLEGASIAWKGLEMFRNRRKVALPHYPFEQTRYWYSHNDRESSHCQLLRQCRAGASSHQQFATSTALVRGLQPTRNSSFQCPVHTALESAGSAPPNQPEKRRGDDDLFKKPSVPTKVTRRYSPYGTWVGFPNQPAKCRNHGTSVYTSVARTPKRQATIERASGNQVTELNISSHVPSPVSISIPATAQEPTNAPKSTKRTVLPHASHKLSSIQYPKAEIVKVVSAYPLNLERSNK